MRHRISTLFKTLTLFITAAIMALSTGCVTQQPKPVADNCPIPSGNRVDDAFLTAQSTLSNPECRYKFDAVLNALLVISQGDPKMENQRLFSDFFIWAEKEGLISKIQAKKYYNTYFMPKFVSLPSNYQTCSHCPNLRKILTNCKQELKKKEVGLLKICNNKTAYAKASDDLQTIALILEAICSACAVE
ncbi:MAG: hypothetical protein V6Z89_20770 [Desulfobacter sp.]